MSLLSDKTPSSQVVLFPVLDVDGLLLADPKRRNFVSRISQHTGLEAPLYQILYESTIASFVELVQALPYHPGGIAGGLMDYSLERATTVLQHYHQSAGNDFSPLYAYALFTAALFQDAGKVISQQLIMISDGQGQFVEQWVPFQGSLVSLKMQYYKLRPISNQWVALGQSATPLLARQCMPAPGFEWIAENYKIFAMWMGILTGAKDREGDLLHWLQLGQKLLQELPRKERLANLAIDSTRPVQTAIGEDFAAWLKAGLQNETIAVNGAEAGAHMLTSGELLLEARLFQDFCKGYAHSVNWVVVCKQFNALGFGKLSGSDFEFEKFFAKTPDTLANENAVRNPKARMFFTPTATDSAVVQGMREGLVVNKAELFYLNKVLPAGSNLTAASAPTTNSLAAVKNKTLDWATRYPIGKSFFNSR